MKLFTAIITCCLIIAFHAPATTAAVDWEVENTFQAENPPLDVAGSLDGKRIFVLTAGGKLLIFSSDGKPGETMEVDPSMDRLDVSGLAPANYQDKIYLSSSKTGKVQVIAVDFSADIDTAGSPFLGSVDAPVELVEFSDFECPFCKTADQLLADVLLEYPEKVKIVFKHFPLAIHKNARSAAMAAIAAHQQGKFWQYHDLLFENSKALRYDKFLAFATELQLDMTRFNNDLVSAEVRQKLEKDIKDGQDAGVTGTPAIFINGRRLKKRDSEHIKKMIEEELAKIKNSVSQSK